MKEMKETNISLNYLTINLLTYRVLHVPSLRNRKIMNSKFCVT